MQIGEKQSSAQTEEINTLQTKIRKLEADNIQYYYLYVN